MAKREFIPIPPPAPLPEPEDIRAEDLLALYLDGKVDLFCVMGPTASGKTKYAVRLAREFNALLAKMRQEGADGQTAPAQQSADASQQSAASAQTIALPTGAEILSGDSRQVYIGMDLGTGKDLADYGEIPYHLIDIVPAGSKYNICQYQRDFSAAFADCRKRGVIPILCGGSGLYIESVTRPEYKMEDNLDLNLELPHDVYFLSTIVDRETRRARIDRRLVERLDEGMLLEIKTLLESGITPEDLIYYGLEYKYLTLYATGQMDVDTMVAQLQIAIHKFAKRQMTWLRGMEKDGIQIHWVKP